MYFAFGFNIFLLPNGSNKYDRLQYKAKSFLAFSLSFVLLLIFITVLNMLSIFFSLCTKHQDCALKIMLLVWKIPKDTSFSPVMPLPTSFYCCDTTFCNFWQIPDSTPHFMWCQPKWWPIMLPPPPLFEGFFCSS